MSSASTENFCKFCRIKNAKYSCPRCNITYCSVPCYQSAEHLECSEEFYKTCIQEELALQDAENSENSSENSKQRILAILQKHHENIHLDNANENLDSDDEESVQELAERLAGVDLDNADQVWKKLTNDEQQDFIAFLKSKDVTNLIPSWEPWWLYSSKTVEELEISENYKLNCPEVVKAKDFSTISAKAPADCVQYNLCNIIAAYVFTARYFNGEHHDFCKESASCIINLSLTLKNNQNFEDYETAMKSVVLQVVDCDWIAADDENFKLIHDDTLKVIKGPAEDNKKYYLISALSDLYRLLNSAYKTNTKESSFNKKILNDHFPDCKAVPKEKLKTVIRKIIYFLSFAKDCLDMKNLI